MARDSSAAEGDHAQPVSATRRQVADRDGDALGDIGLPPIGRSELHRDGGVEDEPRDEHALGEVDADMRLARARRHVPVDPANVVARNVRPHHRELRSGSQEVRPEVTGEQPLHAPPDRDVERAQEPFGHRPGAGTGRGRPREERAGVPHPCLTPRWRARGRAAAWAPLRAPGRGSSRRSPPPRAPGTTARGGVAERRVRVPEDRRPPRIRVRG